MYIKLSTSEFPRYEGDIRLEHPEITIEQTGPTFPVPDTYASVAYVKAPNINAETQLVEMLPPIQDETGLWKMAWNIRELTPEEIQSNKDFAERMLKEQEARTQTA